MTSSFSAGGFDAADSLRLAELDGDGGERYLKANIKEDADHAEDGVRVAPDAAAEQRVAVGTGTKCTGEGDGGQVQEHDGEAEDK
jgi:hypothetical protein